MTTLARQVLVVDDDPDVRDLVAEILRREGLAVSCASDGIEALDLLRRARILPSVILLDLSMAKMGGRELRLALRADPALAAIPVVVLTAEERAWELVEAEMFLTKPCRGDVVLDAVLRFCRAATRKRAPRR